MATDPTIHGVPRPKQARSVQTLERILDAAEALLAERAFAEVSIADIVRRARSSVGGFYGRFRDKSELLLAIHERFVARIDARMDELSQPERWAGASLEQIVQACLAEAVTVYRGRRPIMATFVAQAVNDPVLCKAGMRFRDRVIERFAALVLLRRDVIAHPQPERAASLGAQMVFALLDQSVVFGEVTAAGQRLTDEELARELSRSFLGYLGT